MDARHRQATCQRMAAAYLAALCLSHSGLAQTKIAERPTGPTVGGFIDDMSAWGANHPGAALALCVAVLMAVGMAVYSRIKGKSR